MVALSRILMAVLALFLLLAAVFIGGSIGGFLGGGYMIASVVLVIVFWGVFAGLTINAIRLANAGASDRGSLTQALLWANRLFVIATILSPLTGLGLAFLAFVGCGPLWVPSLYHWGGMVGTILAFLAFFLLPVMVRACVDKLDGYEKFHHWWWVVFMPLMVASIWGTVWLIPYLILKGDIKESDYIATNRVYKLPFPGGESSWVIQGNNSSLNHTDVEDTKPKKYQKYSWDFRRRCGTPVLAARDGTIQIKPIVSNDGMGGSNNQIQVDHGDGTVAFYLHIQKESVPAKFRITGAVVKQGDEIAKVGSVGNSMTGHIHFMVKNGTPTLAVSFTDVREDKGIPRTFSSYTSGNRRIP